MTIIEVRPALNTTHTNKIIRYCLLLLGLSLITNQAFTS